MSLNIRDFSLFFVKNCNPSLKKVTPSLSQQPPLKMEVLSSQRCNPPPPPPPPKQKGGVHTMSWLNYLLSWDFLWQDKKIKINEIINGSVIFKYNSYLNTLNTELWWSCSFFLYWFFPYCSQSSQLLLKNLILEFPKNMIKPPLISLLYLTSYVNFQITLGLIKSNVCGPLLNLLLKT